MIHELRPLRISEKEASTRVWLGIFVACGCVIGCGASIIFAILLYVREAPDSVIAIVLCFALALLVLVNYWPKLKPSCSPDNLETLQPSEVVKLLDTLKHDASREQLREWLKDDHPIRVWDKGELQRLELRLDEDSDRRKLEEFMKSPATR